MRVTLFRAAFVLPLLLVAACGAPPPARPAAPPPADPAFTAIAGEYLEDLYRRQPTQATYLGIHKYDDRLDDYSRQAVTDAVAAARGFRARVAAVPAGLSASNQLDREQLLRAIDSRILSLDVIRPWAIEPDAYSSGITNTACVMIPATGSRRSRTRCCATRGSSPASGCTRRAPRIPPTATTRWGS
jgi:uncharacterized protein (DUF885 family)